MTKQSIGHHRLAFLALKGMVKGPPKWLDRKVYSFRKWFELAESRDKCFSLLSSVCQTLKTCMSPFLLYFDYFKDFSIYFIVKGTIDRLDHICDHISDNQPCLTVSEVEKNILNTLLVTLIVSVVCSCLHLFHRRHHFFVTNYFFNFVLFILSPFLPAIYHMHVGSMSQTLKKERKSIPNTVYQKREQHIAKLRDILQQSKSIEVGVEAVNQIIVLCGLASFFPLVFKGPSGQTYSYFYGVATLVLKGNAPLFCSSILISLLGPCFFFLKDENHKKSNALCTTSKVVLFLRNFLFMLARLGAIISALFLPVICQWDVFVANEGVDASTRLAFPPIEQEFSKHFIISLQLLSDQVVNNTSFVICFLLIHVLVVATNAIWRSPRFGASTMVERWLHLLSSLWLPQPYLTRREVNRGEEKSELRFLLGLHTCENICLLLVSRWAYQPAYPRALIGLDILIVTFNALALALAIYYTSNIELYGDLPDSFPNLPSFGPEVS